MMSPEQSDRNNIVAAPRDVMLDSIRGLALLGILLMNLEVFTGSMTQASTGVDGRLVGLDWWSDAFIFVFVQGKFWVLFALLFGVGIAIMKESSPPPVFRTFLRRRLSGLLLIGLAHSVVLWDGDILLLYAMSGFTLLWWTGGRMVMDMKWAAALFLMPLALTLALGVSGPVGDLDRSELTAAIEKETALMAGPYMDILIHRFTALPGRILASAVFLLPGVMVVFLLGGWLHRSGMAASAPRLRKNELRAGAGLWISGLAIALIGFFTLPDTNPVGGGPAVAVALVINSVGALLMGAGLFLTIRGVWPVRRVRRALATLAPLGRMALTNYLMQSLICVTLFYGAGLGLDLARSWHIPFAIILVVMQAVFSAWWLGRFRMGPVEHVLRCWTQGRRFCFPEPI